MNKKLQEVSGVAVIIENKKGEFLLQLRDDKAPYMKNQWCLLGGGINNGETPEDAIVREIKEEINIDAGSDSLEFLRMIVLKDGLHRSNIYYAKIDLDGKAITVGEGREFRFFSKREILDLVKSLKYTNSFLEALQDCIISSKKY